MTPIDEVIRRLSGPLCAIPTGVQPRLVELRGVRAVLFDVYGTLLISGSGDISLAKGTARADAAVESLEAVGLSCEGTGHAVIDSLHAQIAASHEASIAEYPEVDILDVWRKTLAQLRDQGVLDADSPPPDFQRLAIEYECRVNPIWPMPGLSKCLAQIQKTDLALGVISNAQYFTPRAFPAFLERTLEQLGFDPHLCIWSFEQRRAKPGLDLYHLANANLRDRGIAPGEVLYVGNDMLNDVAPAREIGFRTALFAGDARSLRLREGDLRIREAAPDVILTDLQQLAVVLPLAGD